MKETTVLRPAELCDGVERALSHARLMDIHGIGVYMTVRTDSERWYIGVHESKQMESSGDVVETTVD